jgi:hypothetical protein
MKVFTLPNGAQVSASDRFQIGDQVYPAGWLLAAPDSVIAARGITVREVAEVEAEDIVDPAQQVAEAPPQTNVLSALEFRHLFTAEELVEITTAGFQNAAIRVFMDDEGAAGTVSLSDPEVMAGVEALVTAGLLTKSRAAKILAGTLPA